MTKAQEIKLLDRVIRQFGPDSYIGPWLKKIRNDVVRNIVNDFPADLHLTE